MSNDQFSVPQSSSKALASNRYLWPLRVLTIVLLLLIIIGGPVEQLTFGWLYFLCRVLPKISVDWPIALLGAVSVAIFIIGLHQTLYWFFKQNSTLRMLHWRMRSTVVVATIFMLLFASGTAMVGATHQFIWWLSTSGSTPDDDEARSQLRIPAFVEAVQSARTAVAKIQTKNNLKSLGLAMHNFSDVHGALPPGGVMLADGTPMHGWAILLAAFTNYFDYGKTDYTIPWNRPPNDALFKCLVTDFYSPCITGPLFDDEGYGLSPFAANIFVFPIRTVEPASESHPNDKDAWLNQLKQRGHVIKLSDITDGTSSTIMLGTVAEKPKPWGHPANVRDPSLGINRSPDGFGGPANWHGGMFSMCDGSVRFLNEKIDPKVMRALGTPSASDAIPREILMGN